MHRTLLAMLGSAALAAAGCGDDASSTSSSPSAGGSGPAAAATPAKAAYIDRADAICRDVVKATQRYEDQIDALPPGSEPGAASGILDAGLAETRKGLARLRALPAPREDRATLDAYYDSFGRSLRAYSKLVDAARDHDRAQATKLASQTDALAAEQQRLAKRYGFRACRSA
jgi:hypothetical protein